MEKREKLSILLPIAALVVIVVLVGLIGWLTLGREKEIIQGQMDVTEYRVSSKVPGRILEIRVKEGDYVHAGDTLAILDAPEVNAKQTQAAAVENAAAAMSQMAQSGARQEQIQGAYELWQQAKAALEITEKSYLRVEKLFEQGVLSEQKRDEALAKYNAAQAQAKAAESQYNMAVNGARREEKLAAAAKVEQAKGAVAEVRSYIGETVQTAQMDGEVTDIYPHVGELVGTGSPIMSVAIMSDMWASFNVREDQLRGMKVGDELTAYVPAFDKTLKMKVYYMKDQGSYAVWKATKANGRYDLKT